MRPKIRNKMKSEGFTVKNDISVSEVLSKNGWISSFDGTKDLVEWLFWYGEHGDDVKNLSAFQNIYDDYQHEHFGKEEMFVTDKRGFAHIFELMADEINNLTR